MDEKRNLTTGVVWKTLVRFAFPYLLAAFMQTFYGLADLFVVGIYNGAETTTAVSIGSQVMHMLTVVILGFAMGTTVRIAQRVGAKDTRGAKTVVGTSIVIFAGFALIGTLVLLLFSGSITTVMMTPQASVGQTNQYLRICFAGIPLIVGYNVISSIFRGAGDSKSPMYFVAVACGVNIVLDFVFIGAMGMGAAGAALGTVMGQAVSVIFAALYLKKKAKLGFSMKWADIRIEKEEARKVLGVGTPVALQDGLIQIAFIVITVIANSRGLVAAASVGIVEKIISFLFLVPSSFLSAISAITAHNMGAGKPERARKSLYWGLAITVVWGLLCAGYCQLLPQSLVGLFTRDAEVLSAGSVYLMSYSVDVVFAAIHFCFSGYFCGNQQSGVSFVHNLLSIVLIRVPGAYLTSLWWPESLYPMGWAAPLGSLLSAIICIGVYVYSNRRLSKKKLPEI